QTDQPMALVDLPALRNGCAEEHLARTVKQGARVIVFDGLDEQTMLETGRLLWMRSDGAPFAVGSSGLTHALIHYWRAAGMIPSVFELLAAAPVKRLIVVSGSCSPVTEAQIRRSMELGFHGIRIGDADRNKDEALTALDGGRSVVLYSALGPRDCSEGPRGEELGRTIGVLLRELILRSGARRAVVCGGDTSTHAVRQLGIR